jgi:hypothetical protein
MQNGEIAKYFDSQNYFVNEDKTFRGGAAFCSDLIFDALESNSNSSSFLSENDKNFIMRGLSQMCFFYNRKKLIPVLLIPATILKLTVTLLLLTHFFLYQ